MTKRRTIIALLAVVALVVGVLISSRTREPSYNGRTLSEWLEIYLTAEKATGTIRQNGRTAAEAVRAIGTNALPFLLEWIRYEQNPWQRRLGKAIDAGFAPAALDRLTFSEQRMKRSATAGKGFRILGPDARLVLPDLLRMANDTNSPLTADRACVAMSYLGSDVIPYVVEALTNANHPLHQQAPSIAFEMGYLGTNAASLVPLLVQGTQDSSDYFAFRSIRALGSLQLSPEIAVPALTNGLRHSSPRIRMWAAVELKAFKSAARPAVNALIAARSDPDYSVREAAKEALTEIAPEVLTNAPPR